MSLSIPKLNLSIVSASFKEHDPIKTLPISSSSSPTKLNKKSGLISSSLSARGRKDIDDLCIVNAINYNGDFKPKSARLRETFLDSSREAAFIVKTPREQRISARPLEDLSPHISDFHPEEFNLKDIQKFPETGWITRRSQENAGKMDVSHKKLGDQYTYLMAKELSQETTFLNLCDNRLSDAGIIQLVKCLPISAYKLQSLDLSENLISRKGGEELATYVKKSKNLVQLSLKKMEISDTVARKLATCLVNDDDICSLTSLNLSDNKIEDLGAVAIANSLNKLNLTELSLAWNSIKHIGAIALAEALKDNNKLLSFDLSWNAIGSKGDQYRLTASAIALLLETNSSLTHLDISQNQLKEQDIIVIGEGLKKNHSLLGIHITGNAGKVNAYGDLAPDGEPWPLESAHSMTRIVGPSIKVQGREKWACRNACWICNRWREQRFNFELNPELLNEKKGANTFLKLLTEFDNWFPENMSITEDKADNIYFLYRMVPPGEHFYFFSFQDGALFYDETQPHVTIEEMLSYGIKVPANRDLPTHVNTTFVEDLTEKERLSGIGSLFIEPYTVQPRFKNPEAVVVAVQQKWTPANGLFGNQARFHTEAYMKLVLATDWKYMKFAKGKDTQLVAQIENIFLKNARLLCEVFTHYSCVYTAEIFFISLGSYNEFIQKCKIMDYATENEPNKRNKTRSSFDQSASTLLAKDSIATLAQDSIGETEETSTIHPEESIAIDGGSFISVQGSLTIEGSFISNISGDGSFVLNEGGSIGSKQSGGKKHIMSSTPKKTSSIAKGCTRTEIDMIFVANSITGPKNELNGRRSLCRFQFLECLIGLAAAKFCITGICQDKASALNKLIDDHIRPNAERDDSMKFRDNILLTEVVDTALRNCKNDLDKIYRNYSGQENLPTDSIKTISIKEWINMCDDSTLSDVLGERPTRLAYSRSKIQSKDIFEETTSFKKMNYIEFCEAMIRLTFWIKGGFNAEAEDRSKSSNTDQPMFKRSNRSGELIPVRQLSKASIESLTIVTAEEVAETLPTILKRFNYIKDIKK